MLYCGICMWKGTGSCAFQSFELIFKYRLDHFDLVQNVFYVFEKLRLPLYVKKLLEELLPMLAIMLILFV